MPSRSSLREYHLLIIRVDAGFSWQIRFDKHAKPVETSLGSHSSEEAAKQEGERALAALKAKLLTKE